MNILAVDTAGKTVGVALLQDDRLLYECYLDAGMTHSETLMPLIDNCLKFCGMGCKDIDLYGVNAGPGSFTGLRIGAGVAQGLAAPFATPLIGVPCLDAVACQISAPCVLAATDARMGEVFYAWFDTAALRRLSDYQVGKAAEIALPPGFVATEAKGVGNAFALADAPPFAGKPDMPTAADYLRLAQSGRYAATGAAQAELLDVRNKIALTAQEQAARKALT